MQSLTIRLAKPDDATFITEVYNESILCYDASLETEPRDPVEIRAILEHLDEREAYFLLMRDEEALGWSSIRKYSPRTGYQYTGEVAVYLRRSETGQGFGRFLKKHLIDYCQKLKYHHLVSKVFTTNQACIGLNQALGFELIGIQKEAGMIHGQWLDVAIMQYLFRQNPNPQNLSTDPKKAS